MLVDPILEALEEPLTTPQADKLGAAAPMRHEVHVMPVDDTWSEQEQFYILTCQTKSTEEETWTETEASTTPTPYDRWIEEVEQEEPVPPL